MKYIFLLIPLFLVSQQGLGQKNFTDEFKFKAVYKLTYQPDSTDIEFVLSEPMVLYIGDKISQFSSLGKAVGDSLKANKKREKSVAAFQRLQAQIPKTKFDYSVIKLKPSENIYFSERIAKDELIYEEDLQLMDWEIKPETKEIANYKVQKATTVFAGRKYTAWFSVEIPITDGPYKFYGLPGLIIEVSDEKKDYQFQLTNFQKLEPSKDVSFDPKDHMVVDKDEFREIKRNYDRNPLAALERSGIKIQFSPQQEREAKKELKEKFEKKNNPIELE